MDRKHASLGLVVLVIAANAMGCSTTSDVDSGSAEQDITVHPDGTGDLATVTVHLPSGFKPTIAELDARFVFRFNGTVVVPETPAKVLPTPTHWGCLEVALVTASPQPIARSRECIYLLAPNESRTINLSLLKLWWTNYPNVWASMITSEARGTAILTRDYETNAYAQWDVSGVYKLNGRNDIALPVAPGSYRYRIEGSTLPPFVIDVPEGVEVDRNAAYDDFLAFVDINYPELEGMTDASATASRVTLSCPGASRSFDRPVAQVTDVPVSILLGRSDSPTACTFTINGFSDALSIRAKVRTKLPLGRLNVDDVELTDEGGARVPGDYTVRRFDATTGGWSAWLASGKTRTGLDVPYGKYQIRVTFTPHGQLKEKWLEVAVP